jgi:hypothetical protein
MLPRIGRCPECGSNYDVTAAHREGVFSPQDVEFPYLDVTWSIIGCLMLVWQVIGLATQPEVWVGLFTLVFAVITPLFVKQTWRRVRQYLDAIRQESSAD